MWTHWWVLIFSSNCLTFFDGFDPFFRNIVSTVFMGNFVKKSHHYLFISDVLSWKQIDIVNRLIFRCPWLMMPIDSANSSFSSKLFLQESRKIKCNIFSLAINHNSVVVEVIWKRMELSYTFLPNWTELRL